MSDHLAVDDTHALEITRAILRNTNRLKKQQLDVKEPEPPLYDPKELYGIVGTNLQQIFDVPVPALPVFPCPTVLYRVATLGVLTAVAPPPRRFATSSRGSLTDLASTNSRRTTAPPSSLGSPGFMDIRSGSSPITGYFFLLFHRRSAPGF